MDASSQTPGPMPPELPLPLSESPVTSAAAAVLDAAMGEDGSATSTELANAERSAGILFDAESVEAAVSAAVAQAHAVDRAELDELHLQLAGTAGAHRRVLAIQRLCEGHRGDDLLMVAAIATAAECGSTALDGLPMTLTWNGCLSVDEGKATIECTSSYGGLAELVVTGADRHSLATLLGADVPAVRRECKDKACGTVEDLDASDPALIGWTRVEVAGVEGEPRWYCSAYCVTAALAQAAEELGQDDVDRCVRCGCTQERACHGGCMWVPTATGIPLCSGCASVDEISAGVGILHAVEMRTDTDETPADPGVGGDA